MGKDCCGPNRSLHPLAFATALLCTQREHLGEAAVVGIFERQIQRRQVREAFRVNILERSGSPPVLEHVVQPPDHGIASVPGGINISPTSKLTGWLQLL